MCRLLLLLWWFICLAGGELSGQTFGLKLIDYPENARQGLFELAMLPNGNTLMYGHHFAAGDTAGRGGIVMEVDRTGDIVGPPRAIAGGYGQIKDAIVNADGSLILLTGYQDVVDFRRRAGLIQLDTTGTTTGAAAWVGSGEGIARGRDGKFIVVGREQGMQGAYTLLDQTGRVTEAYRLLPETRRPASLLDVVSLRNGDYVAFGFTVNAIDGVPQSEITLLRFSPEGRVRWAKKITRGAFFGQDGITMSLRAPARLQVDREENLYFVTYAGNSGRSWRPHLVKVTSSGELVYSRGYGRRGAYAGQGAFHVARDGSGLLCFETIRLDGSHGFAALRIDRDGASVAGVEEARSAFDVSSLLPLSDGGYFVTGTTHDCGSARRISYLKHLPPSFASGASGCLMEEDSYEGHSLPVEVVDIELESVPLSIINDRPPALVRLDVTTRSVGCLLFEAPDPPVLAVGCDSLTTSAAIFTDMLTADAGDNIRSLSIELLEGGPNLSLTISEVLETMTTQRSSQAIEITNPGEFGGNDLATLLPQVRLTSDTPENLGGNHAIAVTVTGRCGETVSRMITVRVIWSSDAPTIALADTLALCAGEGLVLRPEVASNASIRWSDGSISDTLARQYLRYLRARSRKCVWPGYGRGHRP